MTAVTTTTGAGFAHLHVASCRSMRYGSSTPEDLVARAAEHGQGALALTDRDGVYGAVRFVRACEQARLAPILGVDLALDPDAGVDDAPPGRGRRSDPSPPRRSPVRGGELVDDRGPRVVVLALGAAAGLAPGRGWAALCRLVTATHLSGERGTPVTTPRLLAAHAAASEPGGPARLRVLLGPDSDVGRALLADGGRAAARARLARWRALLPPDALAVETWCHDAPPGRPGSLAQARRLLALAREAGLPCVLSAAVRHRDPGDATTVDVLDAARRLVVLHERHLDRSSTAGHLASTATMAATAARVAGDDADVLLRDTAAIAGECVQDPRADIGLGALHLPEPAVLGLRPEQDPQQVLSAACAGAIPARYPGAGEGRLRAVRDRLDDELRVIARLGYATYFLTVGAVCDLIRDAGVRVAARGSGAGSLVNHLLGISGIDPLEHDLLMERFCSPLRAALPDIDVDVESARRTQMYELILDRFGGDRVTCVSMTETYRVRHAIRDVGAALGLPPVEVDAIAKAFPHIRARDARAAIADLPELSALGLSTPQLEVFFELVERLDGLPRHLALHPCGIVLSNAGLLDRTPVEASWLGFPMSQFDKDDVEALGLLKLDVLGVRMQSAMAYALDEIERVEGTRIDLDDRACVPLDDPATFDLVASTRTLGCFQIESPGQRELIGKFAPASFADLVIDISLFRPGPVKSDMITPFLRARQGWSEPDVLHPSLEAALAETHGVVVFHEQVLRIVAVTAGVSLAEADEVRRALGTRDGQEEVEAWWRERAERRGYTAADRDRIWEVLAAFASFGFCKAHAAAFALPTYQSAWLKTHHCAAFLAGVLTHDPGMYPKRLILDDARNHGVPILPLDVNASTRTYAVERTPAGALGIRVGLADVKGIAAHEVEQIVAGVPYAGLSDFWHRARVSRPVVERLVLAGAFDAVHGIPAPGSAALGRRGGLTRRDLLLFVGELDRWSRSLASGRAGRAQPRGRRPMPTAPSGPRAATPVAGGPADVRAAAAAQSQAPAAALAADDRSVQLVLDLDDAPTLSPAAGLPELTDVERVRAELDVLGLDVSGHVLEPYADLLDALSTVRAADLHAVRSRTRILVAGVKVATQTPPVRSGRRVVFLTLDDSTGPVDAAFFEDVQGRCAATVFGSWLLLVRGVTRRTGPRGVSLTADGAWELPALHDEWCRGGMAAVHAALAAADHPDPGDATRARLTPRVLLHPSGFRQSPYADVAPAGEAVRSGRGLARVPDPAAGGDAAPRKLWHSSPGSSGH